MKVRVSPDLCCGAQRCCEVAPEFWKLIDGFNAFVSEPGEHEVPAAMQPYAVRGAEACPESAILIIRDDK